MLQESISGATPIVVDGHSVAPVQPARQHKPEPQPAERPPQEAARPRAVPSSEPKVSVREPVPLEELAESLRRINLTFDLFEIAAEYSVNEVDRQVHVTVRNTKTGEVIRQIPPDEFLMEINDFKNGLGFLVNRVF